MAPALQPQSVETGWFGLFPVRSPLLGESRLISFPPGTEMFHFPGLAQAALFIRAGGMRHDPHRVSPFGHLRIIGCLAPPRSFSQLTTSFIASWHQGIRLLLLLSFLTQDELPSLPCSIVISSPAACRLPRSSLGSALLASRIWTS